MGEKEAREYIESIRSRPETREMDRTGVVAKDFNKLETCRFMPIMDESRASEILDKCLNKSCGPFFSFDMEPDQTCCLDGFFTADELEAIAWRMRNKH